MPLTVTPRNNRVILANGGECLTTPGRRSLFFDYMPATMGLLLACLLPLLEPPNPLVDLCCDYKVTVLGQVSALNNEVWSTNL